MKTKLLLQKRSAALVRFGLLVPKSMWRYFQANGKSPARVKKVAATSRALLNWHVKASQNLAIG